MSRLDEIRESLKRARAVDEEPSIFTKLFLDDIEYLLKHIDMLEDAVVIYKLERPATDGVKDDMISKIADRAVNVTPEDASDFIRTGTSRHDWFGEAE